MWVIVCALQRNVSHVFIFVRWHECNFHGVHLFVSLGPKTKANPRMALDSMVFVFMYEG
jgi:hypothetical protein